jgi:hypothetical protein
MPFVCDKLPYMPVHVDQTCNSLKMARVMAENVGILYNEYENIVKLAGS